MSSGARVLFSLALAAFWGAEIARAVDRPIDGTRLVLRRAGGQEKLVFVSTDPSFLFPPIGSADDPATGTPGGAVIEIFSAAEGTASFAVPAGVGAPGWRVRSGTVDGFRYTNPEAPGGPSPVRSVVLKEGRRLRVASRGAGLALAGPQGSVGIRITTGGLRSCALFDASTVRRDGADVFLARGAAASALADCSDAALFGGGCAGSSAFECGGTCPAGSACGTNGNFDGCTCISAAQPCGATSPVCNGECPAGEECAQIGGFPLPGCGCLPTGSTACGQVGCSGACPTGLECNFFLLPFPGANGCMCGAPGPCGSGGDDCPAGFQCAVLPGGDPFCAPTFCAGGSPFPVCDGSCGVGSTCLPLATTEGGLELCVCADPGDSCDASCGGLVCPSGEACTFDPGSQTCSCEPF